MSQISRRHFLPTAAVGLSSIARARGAMRIIDVEVHEILPPYHDYNAKFLSRYHGRGVQIRTIYIVKTDAGLEGLGEVWGPGERFGRFEHYIGSDPFDWVASNDSLPMNMAMYDLMGKYLGIPAWKLLGPKVRDWAPVAAWTVSQPPDALAAEVRSVAARGYRWLKYHVDPFQNVLDQTEAMQKAAPPGFKIHYDFNANSDLVVMLPILTELEKFPIAGRFEDPLRGTDREGYRILRGKCRLPLLVHHAAIEEYMIEHLVDGVMGGHSPLGLSMKYEAIAEATSIPFFLQQCGGTINQAFSLHEAAVFRMATLPQVNLCHLWKDDVTVESMPVVKGSVQVPNKPGLGITIDRRKLETYSKIHISRQPRFLVRMRYHGGPYIYFRRDPDKPGPAMPNLDTGRFPGPVPGYANAVITDFWEDDGTSEFQRLWNLTESGVTWTEARS